MKKMLMLAIVAIAIQMHLSKSFAGESYRLAKISNIEAIATFQAVFVTLSYELPCNAEFVKTLRTDIGNDVIFSVLLKQNVDKACPFGPDGPVSLVKVSETVETSTGAKNITTLDEAAAYPPF